MKFYLGYDGSYVMSRRKLVPRIDGDTRYLSYTGNKRSQIYDLGENPSAAEMLLGPLRLKMFEVVTFEIKPRKPRRR